MGRVLLAWVIGMAAQLAQGRLWPWPVYAGLFVLAGVAAVWLWPARAHGGLKVLVVAVMAFALTGWRASVQPPLGKNVPEGDVVWVRGEIGPRVTDFGLGQRIDLTLNAWRHINTQWTPQQGQVRLSWYRVPANVHLAAGQVWAFPVRLRAPHGHRNPGGMDRELRDWRAGVWATGSVVTRSDLGVPQLLGASAPWGLTAWRHQTRKRLTSAGIDTRWTPWLNVLVLGDQQALSAPDWAVLRDPGTAHLMSISGLHVTVLAAWAYGLLGLLWRAVVAASPRWGLRCSRTLVCSIAAMLAALVYAVFAGWGVPVQRASLMLVSAGVLRFGARSWPRPVMWLWVAAVVLTWDPWAMLQAGFWLSFVAVGLLALWPTGSSAVPRWRVLLATQMLMTVALAPLGAWWFGQVSWVGLLANLIAIPWVSVVVLPLALLGVLFTPVWWVASWAVSELVPVLAWLQSWPGAVWMVTPMPALWALLAMAGFGLAFLRVAWPLRLLCVWMVLPALLWRPERPAAGAFWLDALDVGQGSAIVVRTENHALLFDAGPSYVGGGSAGASIVVPSLRALGVVPDRLVLSHQDHDHVGGAWDVWRAFPNTEIWASFEPKALATTGAEQWSGLGLVGQRCVAGAAWSWDGVRFEFVHPFAHAPVVPRAGNAQSCVLRVSTSTSSAMLMGDLGQLQENELLLQGHNWRTTVLLAGHHGSASSSGQAWMEALRPDWVWVQAGYRNRYHHPAASVMQRWTRMGLAVRNTANCGALHWRSEQPSLSTCEREQHPRYWAHQSAPP